MWYATAITTLLLALVACVSTSTSTIDLVTAIADLPPSEYVTERFLSTGYEPLPPKPADYVIQVFNRSQEPLKEHMIIGLLQVAPVAGRIDVTDPRVHNVLKQRARQLGADALMDVVMKDVSGSAAAGQGLWKVFCWFAEGVRDTGASGDCSAAVQWDHGGQVSEYIEAKVIVFKQ